MITSIKEFGMICAYLQENKLLTYTIDYATMEFAFIEDDLTGKTDEEIAEEVALSRKSLL